MSLTKTKGNKRFLIILILFLITNSLFVVAQDKKESLVRIEKNVEEDSTITIRVINESDDEIIINSIELKETKLKVHSKDAEFKILENGVYTICLEYWDVYQNENKTSEIKVEVSEIKHIATVQNESIDKIFSEESTNENSLIIQSNWLDEFNYVETIDYYILNSMKISSIEESIIIPGEWNGKQIRIENTTGKFFSDSLKTVEFVEVNGVKAKYLYESFTLFIENTTIEFANLNGIDMSSVTSLHSAFKKCSSLTNLMINEWDISNVVDMTYMFQECESLVSIDLEGLDTSNVVSMDGLFSWCTSLTSLDLNSWNTSSVTDMAVMFAYCSTLSNIAIDQWNTSNVVAMHGMFSNCITLERIDIENWDTSSVKNMYSMFAHCTSLKELDLNSWNVSQLENVNIMFMNCSSLSTLDINQWNTSKIEDMGGMFIGCSSLVNLDLNGWDTSSVKFMQSMFEGCISLEQINNNGWDTSDVENMSFMFSDCRTLKNLDINHWNTSNVVTLQAMFMRCQSIHLLDLSGWDTKSVNNFSGLFEHCNSLQVLNISNWNYSNGNQIDAMVWGCDNLEVVSIENSALNLNSNVIEELDKLESLRYLNMLSVKNFDTQTLEKCFTNTQTKIAIITENIQLRNHLNTNQKKIPIGPHFEANQGFYNDGTNNKYLIHVAHSSKLELALALSQSEEIPRSSGYIFKDWIFIENQGDGKIMPWSRYYANYDVYNEEKPSISPNPNEGRTCQDDGYTNDYYWNGTACVIDLIKTPVDNKKNETKNEETTLPDIGNNVENDEVKAPEKETVIEIIPTDKTPLNDIGGWSLINVIITGITILLMAISLVAKKRKEEVMEIGGNEIVRIYKRNLFALMSIITIAISLTILLLITNDFTLNRILINQWTPLFIVGMTLSIILFFLSIRWKEIKE